MGAGNNNPFKDVFSRSSRGNEAPIFLETIVYSEPPHVGCYFFNGLQNFVAYATKFCKHPVAE
jgi:hypothetical protein